MNTAVSGVKLVGPDDAAEGFLGSIGVRFMIDGTEAAQRFSLLSEPLELTPQSLTDFPGFFGQHAKVLGCRPGRFRLDASLFDDVAGLLHVLALVLRDLARALSFDAIPFRRNVGHLCLPSLGS